MAFFFGHIFAELSAKTYQAFIMLILHNHTSECFKRQSPSHAVRVTAPFAQGGLRKVRRLPFAQGGLWKVRHLPFAQGGLGVHLTASAAVG